MASQTIQQMYYAPLIDLAEVFSNNKHYKIVILAKTYQRDHRNRGNGNS